MNILSRVCGAPIWHAENKLHSASYPLLAKFPRTLSSPLFRNADTFSTTTNLGRISQTIRNISAHNPLRLPSIPSRFPALLMSWQGKPPHTTSTCAGLNVLMSSCFGTPGQCLSKTFRANGSISTCHAHFNPALSNPRSMPPMPENKEPYNNGLQRSGDNVV
jgi:hypothetical protein